MQFVYARMRKTMRAPTGLMDTNISGAGAPLTRCDF